MKRQHIIPLARGAAVTLTSISTGAAGFLILRAYETNHWAASRWGDSKDSAEIFPSVFRMSDNRHLCGTHPRDFHCWKVLRGTPSALAASLTNCQSNDGCDAVMGRSLTDKSSVTQGKFVSGLNRAVFLQFIAMTAEEEEDQFNIRLKALFREQRLARGWTHKQMAAYFGLPEPRYTAYETRAKSEIPPYLIPKFVTLTGVDLHFAMGMLKPKPSGAKKPRKQKGQVVRVG